MRRRTWMVVGALAVLTVVGTWGDRGAVQAAEVVRPVLADTWIDGLASSGPHGGDLTLGICPVANYWIYLRFDLTDIPGTVESAEVRMTRFNGSRPDEICAYLIPDDSWSESGLSGVNRPDPSNPPTESALATGFDTGLGYDRWQSVPLTQAILDEASGDGVLTLMLRENPSEMFDIRFYRSKEASVPATQKPQLVLNVVPGEIDDLGIASGSPAMLEWSAGGSVHDVAGGTLRALRRDGDVGSANCLANDLTAASFTDTQDPPVPGQGYYYMVRAQIGATPGSYGADSNANERLPLDACP